jgi:hypothetical protein
MKELKEIFAEGAASPEWQSFDREVEERIGVLEREFLLSREPITKHSVARFHARRDALVVETQEKWVAVQQRRLALWQTFPQKADANDPEIRPLAQQVADIWWEGRRRRKIATERFGKKFEKAGLENPFELIEQICFTGVDVYVQHTRFDPHEHVPPQQPTPPQRQSKVPHPPAAAYLQRSTIKAK